jgi:predicted RNase H-like HicB family nuclease
MLTEYIQRAMHHAHYEIMENGHYFGSIPQCQGVWAEGKSLEECPEELAAALESWIVVGLRHGDTLPVIDGLDLNFREYAEPHQVA